MRPGEREELVRLCRRAVELRARAVQRGGKDAWEACDRALTDLHVVLSPRLVLELLGEETGHG